MKLTTNNHYQLHITLMILRRSMGQRSRSASNGHRNIVNAMPPPNRWREWTKTYSNIVPRTD